LISNQANGLEKNMLSFPGTDSSDQADDQLFRIIGAGWHRPYFGAVVNDAESGVIPGRHIPRPAQPQCAESCMGDGDHPAGDHPGQHAESNHDRSGQIIPGDAIAHMPDDGNPRPSTDKAAENV